MASGPLLTSVASSRPMRRTAAPGARRAGRAVSDAPAGRSPGLGLLLLIALMAAARAADNQSEPFIPQQVSLTQALIGEDQTVSLIGGGGLRNLTIRISVPPDAAVVSAPEGTRVETDGLGNRFIQVSDPAPTLPYHAKVSLSVEGRAQRVDTLPASFDPRAQERYLGSSEKVPSEDPEMRRLARAITANATTPFEQVSALARWTYDHIDYDIGYLGRNLDARSVLEQRRGVCSEYATLFVTLSRAVGIPARFVNGYTYSQPLGDWSRHAWAEVYIGRWVSVDPTWLEVGDVDGTHIVGARFDQPNLESASINALVDNPQARLDWDSGTPERGARASNLRIQKMVSEPRSADYALGVSSRTLAPGARFVAYLGYNASDYRLLEANLAACRSAGGQGVVDLEGANMRLDTRPNQTRYLIWEGKARADLRSDSRYTCPLFLNSPKLAGRAVDVRVDPRTRMLVPLQAQIKYPLIAPGQAQTILVSAPASLVGKNITLLEDRMLSERKVERSDWSEYAFVPAGAGEHTLYLLAEGYEPQVIRYRVEMPDGRAVVDVEPEGLLAEDQPGVLRFNISRSADAANQTLYWTWAGQSGETPLRKGEGVVRVPFTPAQGGQYLLMAYIGDGSGTRRLSFMRPLGALAASSVSVARVGMARSGWETWNVTLAIDAKGPVADLRLEVANRTIALPSGGGAVSFELPTGRWVGRMRWKDALNRTLAQDVVLNATELEGGTLSHFTKGDDVETPKFSDEILLAVGALLIILALVWLFRSAVPRRGLEAA